MRTKKHLAGKLRKTYMLEGEFFYSRIFRKKAILLSDLSIKQLWKPVVFQKKVDRPIVRYFEKWGNSPRKV